jgi:hypothetical protein
MIQEHQAPPVDLSDFANQYDRRDQRQALSGATFSGLTMTARGARRLPVACTRRREEKSEMVGCRVNKKARPSFEERAERT